MEKFLTMKCMPMFKNVSSKLFDGIFSNRTILSSLPREQHVREADDFISTLDPKHTNKITFDAYIKDNYGDLDVKQLENSDKFDSRSRETRRVCVL